MSKMMIESYQKELLVKIEEKVQEICHKALKPATITAYSRVFRADFIPFRWSYDEGTGKWFSSKLNYSAPDEEMLKAIYTDSALVVAIRDNKLLTTCSQPCLILYMIDIADIAEGDHVLEIGTGSGYNSAIISEIVGEGNIASIEIESEVAEIAKKNLERAGKEIAVITGDGGMGFSPYAPYKAIIVTCATPDIPWFDQLQDGGTIIIPLLTRGLEMLCRFVKRGDRLVGKPLLPVRFLTFTGLDAIKADYKKNIHSLTALVKKAQPVENLTNEFIKLSRTERNSFKYYLSLLAKEAIYFVSDDEDVSDGYGIWKKTLPFGIVLIQGNKIIHWGDPAALNQFDSYFSMWKASKLKYDDYDIVVYPHDLHKEIPKEGLIVDKKFNSYSFIPKNGQ
ncbi:hypothetical protein KAI78_06220 [bacterium]|nr:hypothetical protein [bacterium]